MWFGAYWKLHLPISHQLSSGKQYDPNDTKTKHQNSKPFSMVTPLPCPAIPLSNKSVCIFARKPNRIPIKVGCFKAVQYLRACSAVIWQTFDNFACVTLDYVENHLLNVCLNGQIYFHAIERKDIFLWSTSTQLWG